MSGGGWQKVERLASTVMPFAIIGGLLYAGLFIQPKSVGASVRPPVINKKDAFYGIAVPGDKVVWAVGRKGKIVRSEDGGRVWVPQAGALPANLQSIAAWDEQRALVVGNNGAVQTTSDGGKTWKVLPQVPRNADSQKYIRTRVGANGAAWIVGEFGLILASSDYGASWQAIGAREDIAWNDIAVVDKTMLVVGEFGKMRRSTDAGASWQEIVSPVKTSLLGVALRQDGQAVAVGLEGVILVSADAGATWTSASSGTREHLFGVVSGDKVWFAVGDQGIILQGTESGEWLLRRVAERVYAWHADVQVRAGTIYMAGATLSALAPGYNFIAFK